jgi:competence protein ComEA
MNSIRKWIRDLFGFSGNEINGFLILIPLMLLLIFSEPVYNIWSSNRSHDDVEDRNRLDSLVASWRLEADQSLTPPKDSLFLFDPNIAGVKDLQLLGFSPFSAKRIAAYRSKGGVFRVKADLMKIYGLDSALYQQLYPYIKLPVTKQPPSVRTNETYTAGKFSRGKESGWQEEKDSKETFDINAADTVLLKGIYGIGPKLAARIIKFRDALGGFVRNEQVGEVYGLDSVVIQRLLKVSYIKDEFEPRKININTADKKELSAHPYISYQVAEALLTYRFQHGHFAEVNDIKKLVTIPNELADRLLPYIKVED